MRSDYAKRMYRNMNYLRCAFAAAALFLISAPAIAYPEFQAYSQENSGMGVSCAMCHVHPDGPDGAAHGQVGGLAKEALEQLNSARAAFEPGVTVESPILNKFGNDMIRQLGRKKVIELKQSPEELAAVLDQKSDLDDDGAADAREYKEGTHPLHKSSGNPWLLFIHNFKRHLFSIIMVTLAIFSLMYGFRNLHLALEVSAGDSYIEDDDLEPEEVEPAAPGTAAIQPVQQATRPHFEPASVVSPASTVNAADLR